MNFVTICNDCKRNKFFFLRVIIHRAKKTTTEKEKSLEKKTKRNSESIECKSRGGYHQNKANTQVIIFFSIVDIQKRKK